jgi:branched-chain amino acid transport system permease protein
MTNRLDSFLQARFGKLAWPLSLVGALLVLLGGFMRWTYDPSLIGNVTLYFNPAPVQYWLIALGAIGILFLITQRTGLQRALPGGPAAVRAAAIFSALIVLMMAAAIVIQLGGLVNLEPAIAVPVVGALLMLLASRALPSEPPARLGWHVPGWGQILMIAAALALALFSGAYLLNQDDGWIFVGFMVFVTGVVVVCRAFGLLRFLTDAFTEYRRVTLLAAVVAAFAFPFTQNGSDANMSIATQVLIFATTAIGLNIVVGLAGLLDLGYIAFLGTGAYVGAMFSNSAFATIGWHPPFIVVMLFGAVIAACFGLIIGSPTLRISGDYLAIVTLAFGEIFRLTMNNLDGTNGPNLTHGPNGIPSIPDLNVFGFDFGQPHVIFGITLGRFANYYFLLLVVIGFVVLAFARLNDSRIGRGWVAIREDERAAEAMGINTFALKLLAFAGGAFLAGLAGTIKAHHDVSVTPDQYQFLESAFLLAAVVLGGMGTVGGVLLGATILKLLPEKLRFFADYRLLLFGLLLVVMMRFRPEGMIASRRRQLELHEEDEELASELDTQVADTELRVVKA